MVSIASRQEKHITNDEIEQYVDASDVSALEAYWLLFEFKILHKNSSVSKLPLHLEDKQTVLFTPEEAQAVASNPPPQINLTALFEMT